MGVGPIEPGPDRRPDLGGMAAALAVTAVASVVSIAPQHLRPHVGPGGVCLVMLLPALAAARVSGWRAALTSLLAAAVGIALSDPADSAGVTAAWVAVFLLAGGGVVSIARAGESACRALSGGLPAERLRRLLAADVIPMAVASPAGVVFEANGLWLSLAGRTRDDLGTPALHHDRLRPADRPGDPWPTEPDGVVGPFETAYLRPDGVEVPVLAHAVRMGDGSVLKICLDLTPSRRVEDQLREADRRKNEAMAMLAHELRNPLAPIRNAAQLVRSAEVRGERERWVRVIEDQVGILSRLVDDLLDVARVQQGKVEIAKTAADLAELVTAAAEACRPLFTERRHQLFVGIPQDGPVYAEVDTRRFSQVVFNLLTNAAKYTPPGGNVWVTLERQGGEAVVRVRDNGLGIDPEFLPHVWDIFSQQKTGLDRPGGGLGLGLTLVRRLVELHGGRVEAASDGPGKGSEFCARFPRKGLAWKAHRRPAGSPPPTRHRRRVLIVDDNFAVAETTGALLRTDGHAVTVVHDGEAALATAAQVRPDVVLLDIGLPGMNGFEVARRLRAAGVRAVLVAVTGYTSERDRAAGREAGFDHYLAKPVETDAIRDLLADGPAAPPPDG